MFRSLFSRGQRPLGAKQSVAYYSPWLVLVVSLGMSGCAKDPATGPQARVYQPPARVAGYRHENPVVIEDDGIEEQAAPLHRQRKAVDDPTEPFSPNYGRFTALRPVKGSSSPIFVPNDLPDDFRAKLVSRQPSSPKL